MHESPSLDTECVNTCMCMYVWSLRSHQMYYMFGFLFLVFIILIVTCSETTILLCYFHLCAEVGLLLVFHSVFLSICVCLCLSVCLLFYVGDRRSEKWCQKTVTNFSYQK